MAGERHGMCEFAFSVLIFKGRNLFFGTSTLRTLFHSVMVAKWRVALLKRNVYDSICGTAADLNGEPKYTSVSFSSDMEFVEELVLLVLLHTRTGPTHVDAPGRLTIWRPFKPIFFKPFRPKTGLARAKIADNFACGYNYALTQRHTAKERYPLLHRWTHATEFFLLKLTVFKLVKKFAYFHYRAHNNRSLVRIWQVTFIKSIERW
jgi:hypothetical protein